MEEMNELNTQRKTEGKQTRENKGLSFQIQTKTTSSWEDCSWRKWGKENIDNTKN